MPFRRMRTVEQRVYTIHTRARVIISDGLIAVVSYIVASTQRSNTRKPTAAAMNLRCIGELVVWSQFSWREKTPSHDDTSAREKEKRKNRRRNKQLIRHYNRLSLWGRGRCGSSCGADGQHAESFRLFHTDSELNDRWTRSKLGPIRRSFSGRINISSRQCR